MMDNRLKMLPLNSSGTSNGNLSSSNSYSDDGEDDDDEKFCEKCKEKIGYSHYEKIEKNKNRFYQHIGACPNKQNDSNISKRLHIIPVLGLVGVLGVLGVSFVLCPKDSIQNKDCQSRNILSTLKSRYPKQKQILWNIIDIPINEFNHKPVPIIFLYKENSTTANSLAEDTAKLYTDCGYGTHIKYVPPGAKGDYGEEMVKLKSKLVIVTDLHLIPSYLGKMFHPLLDGDDNFFKTSENEKNKPGVYLFTMKYSCEADCESDIKKATRTLTTAWYDLDYELDPLMARLTSFAVEVLLES